MVSHKLRRRNGALLDLLKRVLGVQRVIRLSRTIELDALWHGSLNIIRLIVVLRLVQADVQIAGPRPLDIPVLVSELRFLHLLRPMQLRRRPYTQSK